MAIYTCHQPRNRTERGCRLSKINHSNAPSRMIKKNNTKALHKEANIDPLKVRRIRHTLQHIFQISQANSFTGWKARASIVTRSNKKKLMVLKKPQTKRGGGRARGGDLVSTLPGCVCRKVKDMGPFSASSE